MTKAHDESFSGGENWDSIEQKAAEWVTRIDLRGTPEEWAALDVWLAASPRHRAAFLRLSVAWRRADALRKLAPLSGAVDEDLLDPVRWKSDPSDDEVLEGRSISLQPHAGNHADEAPALRVVVSNEKPLSADRDWAAARSYRSRREAPANDSGEPAAARRGVMARFGSFTTSRLAAAAALVAVVAGGGAAAWYAIERGKVDIYATHVGEFQRVALDDGSTIELNTDSEVRVRYSDGKRHVDLTRGEALFHVAKNPNRPFDVDAGDTTVLAVGTAFSVRLHEEQNKDRVDVVVSEGRIAINPPSSQTYPAGTVATVRNGRVAATTVESEDITGRLSWTIGRLVFQGEKLGDVVAEINRYNERKLMVSDPDISGLRIGGTFQATDPEGFARALDRTFGIKSHAVSRTFGPDTIHLDSGVP
jgi:transmembrane sensor